MERKVTVIPATLNMYTMAPVSRAVKRRVAGYARVSTNLDDQATSYEAQMSYYKSYIHAHDDWDYVGMYSDEGVTGTSTKRREGFNRMLNDAMAGKIDLIITKSVSRFARNTVDSISTIRQLKEKGVEVYFEKENIWTLDSKGELLITIMSSMAQEESRSISENVKWGRRKSFEQGKSSISYSRFLGYDEGFKINEEQAKIVRLIYKLYISGLAPYGIKKELEKRELKTATGGDVWHISSIQSILSNEKYKGDALLQKQYTADFLKKNRKKNRGEIPQYYVEGHHEPIITPKQFDYVQAEMKRRAGYGRYSAVSIFCSKVQCGCCGGWYGRMVWHSTDKYRRVIYKCHRKMKRGERPCSTPHFTEEQLKSMFIRGFNSLTDVRNEVIENLNILIDSACNISQEKKEKRALEHELMELSERLGEVIRMNGMAVKGQEIFIAEEEKIRNTYEDRNKQLEILEATIDKKNYSRITMEAFIENMQKEGRLVDFRPDLWGLLVERIVVNSSQDMKMVFRGGITVKI